jgi:hypothetical protein
MTLMSFLCSLLPGKCGCDAPSNANDLEKKLLLLELNPKSRHRPSPSTSRM